MPARPTRWMLVSALALAVAGALLLPVSARSAVAQGADPCVAILNAVARHPDIVVGVVLQDIRTGARCEVNAGRQFRTASLYKLVVLAELMRQQEAGLVSFLEPLVIEPRHHLDDPPEFWPEEPYEIAVGDAAARMITFSDNGSAEALRERLGLELVDAAPAWLGMPGTVLADWFRTTPADQASLYARIDAREVVSPLASERMLTLLRAQEIGDLIPQALPAGTGIAHKTGLLEDSLHDVGIVDAPGGRFILAVLTEYPGGYEGLEPAMRAIQDVSGAVYALYSLAQPPTLLPEWAFLATEGRPEALPGLQLTAMVTTPVATVRDIQPVVSPLAVERESLGSAALWEDLLATRWWSQPGGVAALLALLAAIMVIPTTRVLRRRPAIRYGVNALSPEVAHAAASERAPTMRFGRKDDDVHTTDARADARNGDVLPASRSVAEVGVQPVVPSKRLQRVAEHFAAQTELLTQMRDQFEDEMEPLHELLVRQSEGMRRLLANLEERLRPLNEYADGEEANLDALEHRIEQGGADHVARSFAKYLTDQRERIGATRDQIDQQRMPFLRYGEDQRDTIEVALARFDQDIAALEQNLAEQRRVMMRMLDAMRSDTFTAVRDYLAGRQEALEQAAQAGSTDPAEIARTAQQLRRDLEKVASESDFVRGVLERADRTDKALAEAAPAGPYPMPRPHGVPEPVEAAQAEAGA